MNCEVISCRKLYNCIDKNAEPENNIDELSCCSIGDILFSIELLRKRKPSSGFSACLLDNSSCLVSSIREGDIIIASLNSESLINGLFLDTEDEFEFWDKAIDDDVEPHISINLITLKSIDKIWGTDFLQQSGIGL